MKRGSRHFHLDVRGVQQVACASFIEQRSHLIHLCSGFNTVPACHTGGAQQIFCDLVNYCSYSESSSASLGLCRMSLYLLTSPGVWKLPFAWSSSCLWEIIPRELACQWAMFHCLTRLGRGHRALGRGATILPGLQIFLRPSFLSQLKGVAHVEGPKWRVGTLSKPG